MIARVRYAGVCLLVLAGLAAVVCVAVSGPSRAQQPQRTGQTAAGLNAGEIDPERARLIAQLQETARSVQESEARLSSIETRRDALDTQRQLLQGSLSKRHASITAMLASLQRMARNPPPVIITRREDALGMVRSAMLLARAVPELETKVRELVADLDQIDGVIRKIGEEREKLKVETPRLKEMQTRLAALMEKRRQAQADGQGELEELRKEASAMAGRIADIGQLIVALDVMVANRTGLGTYESQLAPAAATPAHPAVELRPSQHGGEQAEPGGPQGAETPPEKDRKSQQVAIVLTPATGPFAASPGRMKPAVPFHLAKGQLPSPAHGQRVVSFGETTSHGRKSQGIVIETRYGAHITSPCDGWVVYAGEFRSYGQLLIINAGGGYHVLLAGLSHIDAQLGQFVLAGEPVGMMSAALAGKTQDNAPVLYVEFRKEGRPIDPSPWWHEGQQQKVQG